MPVYSSDATKTEVAKKISNAFLYDNLNPDGWNAPFGYWTLSVSANTKPWHVNRVGQVHDTFEVSNDTGRGVRPVINLKL